MCIVFKIGCKVTNFIPHLQIFCAKNEEKCTFHPLLCITTSSKLHIFIFLSNYICIFVLDNYTFSRLSG